jgi:two-component system NtrC family sensor kinase
MKTLTLTLFFFLITTAGFTQNQQIVDSLKHELTIAKHDTNRVLLMTELGEQYRNSNADSALLYGKQTLALAKQIKFLKGELKSMYQIGFAHRQMGNYTDAFAMALKGLRTAEKYRYLAEIADFHNLLGIIYQDFKNHKKAIYHFLMAIKIAGNLQDEINVARMQSNLALSYFENNQLGSASFYVNKAHQSAFRLNHKVVLTTTLRNLGRIQFATGHYREALDYYRQSLQNALTIDNNNKRYSAYIYNLMGSVYLKKSQTDSCIFYAKQALINAPMSVQSKRRNIESYTLLVDAYKSKKDFRRAFAYKELLDDTKEELFGESNMQAIQTLLDQDQEQQKQLEIERLAYESRLKQYAFLVGLGVFLFIAAILYRNNRQKHKANILLNEQKEKVEQTLAILQSTQAQLIQKEKLASLGELTAGIAHEIQNPLNFVNNFSELSVELVSELLEERSKEHGKRDEALENELLNDLAQNQEKINHHGKRASSIVKGMLEHSKTSSGERELTDMNQLADEYLRLSYHGLRAKNQDFNSDYELITDKNLPKTEVVSQEIGRVLLNLLNNAFYAVNERAKQENSDYQPKVTVTTKVADNQLEIRVADNGNGIPEATKAKIFQPFFTTKPTGEGTGLGLSLSYDIVTKGHGGTIEVVSKESQGAEFIIKLPIKTT